MPKNTYRFSYGPLTLEVSNQRFDPFEFLILLLINIETINNGGVRVPHMAAELRVSEQAASHAIDKINEKVPGAIFFHQVNSASPGLMVSLDTDISDDYQEIKVTCPPVRKKGRFSKPGVAHELSVVLADGEVRIFTSDEDPEETVSVNPLHLAQAILDVTQIGNNELKAKDIPASEGEVRVSARFRSKSDVVTIEQGDASATWTSSLEAWNDPASPGIHIDFESAAYLRAFVANGFDDSCDVRFWVPDT